MANLILGEQHEYCHLLATYLRDAVNQKYECERDNNTALPQRIVIRGIRNFDDPSVTISEFPLLKVYRTQDIFDGTTPYRMSNATITYSTAYSDLQELPDLLYWISLALQKSIVEFSYIHRDFFDIKQNNKIAFQYLLTQVGNTVYPFLRANINFKDNFSVCSSNKMC